MEVLLRKDVDKLGKKGEIVKVKNGYGRNFLIPKGFAVLATKGNLKIFEEEKKIELRREEKKKKAAEELAKKIKKISVTIVRHAGEGDKLYGSVTNADIAEALNSEGFEVDKKDVLLEEPIKSLGVYSIQVKLHPEVTSEVKVWVVKEKEEE
ncbi:MAG: 50S ribosomal protein L9 [Candidatus Schekmanbacteria bacterium]|nr:MAG: 50S ribosomal protein L9 [Candidatus Schekmanbacteria bacterium]